MHCINPACTRPHNPARARFCQSCGAELQKPYIFRDRYRVLEILGQGGFGRTYKAQDLEFEKRFYVIKKLIAPETFGQYSHLQPQVRQEILTKASECFKREIQQLASLDHPQIPHFYEHFEENGSPYLVQEYIKGDNLLAEYRNKGPLNETEIRELLESLLPVLQYLHSYGILHRDIKPENIMRRSHISGASQLVLIDFGGAKQKAQNSFALAGTAFYSPGYASPEHTTGQHQPTSDLYSLGATCVRLLTGSFPGDCEEKQIFLNGENRWLWQQVLVAQGRSVSDELAYIFDKMLRWMPSERYQSATEVLEALHRSSSPQVNLPPPSPNFAPSLPFPTQTLSLPIDDLRESRLAERDRKLARKSVTTAAILTFLTNLFGYVYTGRYKALLVGYAILCFLSLVMNDNSSMENVGVIYIAVTTFENSRAVRMAKKRNFKRSQKNSPHFGPNLKIGLLRYMKLRKTTTLSDLVIDTGLEVKEIQTILNELERDNLVKKCHRFTMVRLFTE